MTGGNGSSTMNSDDDGAETRPMKRVMPIQTGRGDVAGVTYDATPVTERTVATPAVAVPTATPVPRVPRKLAHMLLPGERVTFGSTTHPIVFALPLFFMILIAVAAGVALDWTVPGDVHGTVAMVPLLTGVPRVAVIGVGIALELLAAGMFVKRTLRFLGLRVVATNRRIFAIRGVIVRRITPLGNTALAGSTMSQGLLGRIFGYGNIDLPLADGTPGSFRDMHDPLHLYREFQAVANGVDGDTWTPATRNTIIP